MNDMWRQAFLVSPVTNPRLGLCGTAPYTPGSASAVQRHTPLTRPLRYSAIHPWLGLCGTAPYTPGSASAVQRHTPLARPLRYSAIHPWLGLCGTAPYTPGSASAVQRLDHDSASAVQRHTRLVSWVTGNSAQLLKMRSNLGLAAIFNYIMAALYPLG